MLFMFYCCINITSLDLSNFDMSKVIYMKMMIYWCCNLTTTFIIRNNEISNYDEIFYKVATVTIDGDYINRIIVNYISDAPNIDINESTENLVDDMIATKSENSNVVKRVYIGDNCPATT